MKRISLIGLAFISPILADEVNLGDIDVSNSNISTTNTQIGEYSSSRTLSREKLDKITSKNHDIGEALKTNPNVILNTKGNPSDKSGEINPQNFSINGASFYQNNFLVDGINFNNDMDPTRTTSLYKNIWRGPGLGSQAANLSTDLFETLEVIDSSVSAKYGNFLGGVINAKTRDPRPGFHGIASLSYTSGKWSKSFYDELIIDKYKDQRGWIDTSDFVKKRYRIGLEGYLSEDFGLIFDYTRYQSKFKNKTKPSIRDASISKFPDDKRLNENFYIKGVWNVTEALTLKPTFIYAPQVNHSFIEDDLNSATDAKFGGYIGQLEANLQTNLVQIDQTLNYTNYQMSRYFDEHILYSYKYSDIKNWGGYKKDYSYYGGLGDVQEKQNQLGYKADVTFNEILTGKIAHKFGTGIELSHQDATLKTPKPFIQYDEPKALPDGYVCSSGDLLCVNDNSFMGNGQFLSRKFYFGDVNSKVNLDSLAFYLEDEMKYSRFKFRPGLRLDRDSMTNSLRIAPRFVTQYDILGDESNFIGLGLNRYYGRNLFAYKLYSDFYAHYYKYTRTSPDEGFKEIFNDKNAQANSDFKTPHDDELSLFYTGDIKNARFNVKYVKRKTKNEIISIWHENSGDEYIEGLDNSYRTYENGGKANTDIYTLSIQNITPMQFYSTTHNAELALTYMHQKKNFTDYSTSGMDTLVVYNNKIIKRGDLPVVAYYVPYIARFNYNIGIPAANLNITNFFNYTGKTNSFIVGKNPQFPNLREYRKVTMPGYFTWDMKFAYNQPIKKNVEFFANLDINNILNDKHSINAWLSSGSTYFDYGVGRNIWLEAGLKW